MSPFVVLTILALLAVTSAFLVALRGTNKRTVNEVIKDKVVLKIAVPRQNDKSPIAAEQLFSSLHGIGANKKKSMDHISLEIAAGSYGIHFIVVVDRKFKGFTENQFYAQYPEAQISEIGDYTNSFDNNSRYEVKEFGLGKPFYLPIKTFMSFEVDPLAAITSAVSSLKPGNEAFIQLVIRPVSDDWHKQGRDYVDAQRNKVDKEGKKVGLESGESEKLGQIERKSTKVGFQFVIRILSKCQDQVMAGRLVSEIEAAFGQYKTGLFNNIGNPPGLKGWDLRFKNLNDFFVHLFYGTTLSDRLSKVDKYKQRFIDEMESDIINTEEVASLYHLPNRSVETPNISWAEAKKLEFPLNIPTEETARTIGLTDYRGIHVKFGIKAVDRLRHMYLIGKTGMGKSTFLESMIIEDIYKGEGVAYIDPHGDNIAHLLDLIPPERKGDVVIFDPGDSEYPVGLNLLELKPGENRSLVADGLVSVFKKAFADSWGPRLEYILTNTIITLLECQNVSLLAIPRILTEKNYRKFLLKQVKDPVMLKFWDEEYAQMSKTTKDTMENTSSILNKIGRFTTNPLIRNIVGQVTSTLDIAEVMNNRKILMINLSQGKVGEENMALLGGMLITKIYSNTVRRIEIDPSQRVPFYLYVDEFQNFATSTFVKILSEARKFGLGLVVTHQFIDQINEDIRNAIVGNIGTMMNFAVGPRDADFLVKEYAPYLTAEDLVNQEKFGMVLKMSIDFAQSKPFTAKTIPPQFPSTGQGQEIVDLSRKKYSQPREIMEEKIFKWASQVYDDKGNLLQPGEIPVNTATRVDGPPPRRDDRPPMRNNDYKRDYRPEPRRENEPPRRPSQPPRDNRKPADNQQRPPERREMPRDNRPPQKEAPKPPKKEEKPVEKTDNYDPLPKASST